MPPAEARVSRSAQMAGAVHAVARLYQWPGLLLALTAIFGARLW